MLHASMYRGHSDIANIGAGLIEAVSCVTFAHCALPFDLSRSAPSFPLWSLVAQVMRHPQHLTGEIVLLHRCCDAEMLVTHADEEQYADQANHAGTVDP